MQFYCCVTPFRQTTLFLSCKILLFFCQFYLLWFIFFSLSSFSLLLFTFTFFWSNFALYLPFSSLKSATDSLLSLCLPLFFQFVFSLCLPLYFILSVLYHSPASFISHCILFYLTHSNYQTHVCVAFPCCSRQCGWRGGCKTHASVTGGVGLALGLFKKKKEKIHPTVSAQPLESSMMQQACNLNVKKTNLKSFFKRERKSSPSCYNWKTLVGGFFCGTDRGQLLQSPCLFGIL